MPKGFAIIEVVIVLVVGAVIMLTVFLIVPQLQRSSRNSLRQRDAKSLITSAYEFRDSGKLSGIAIGPNVNNTDAFTDYLPRTPFNDPNGNAYKIFITNNNVSRNTAGNITIGFNRACSAPISTSQNLTESSGNVAIVVPLEPFGNINRFCIDDAGE